jgi:hypothetical protein
MAISGQVKELNLSIKRCEKNSARERTKHILRVTCDDIDEMHKTEALCLFIRGSQQSWLCAFAVTGTTWVIDSPSLHFTWQLGDILPHIVLPPF